MASERISELKGTGYEIFIASVAVLSIVNLGLMLLVKDDSLDYVLFVMNGILSIILFVDFCYRLYSAQSRADYFIRQFGWADLLASLPLPQFKVLRIFRLGRVVRLLRDLGIRRIVRALVRNRAGSALLSLLFIAILVLEFGSLAMLGIESNYADANITTASDSLWYLIVTMSTVGYGDQFPVSNPGRLLGALVIMIGVGIFGTLTGFLANAFLSAPPEEDGQESAFEDEGAPSPGLHEELEQLRDAHAQMLARIEKLLSEASP